jgi:WD40 repeat protein
LRISTAERLAVLSYAKRSEAPLVSLLLAVESGRATREAGERPLVSSHQALIDALSAVGGRPLGHQDRITTISADGRWVVTATDDGAARVWDLATETPTADPRVLSMHKKEITCAAIAAAGRWIVTADSGQMVRIWDLAAEDPGLMSRALTGHQGFVHSVAISADGRWVAASSDNEAWIWDAQAEDLGAPRVLSGDAGGIGRVAISPNGHWLVTGAESLLAWPGIRGLTAPVNDAAVRIWDLTAGDPGNSVRILVGNVRGESTAATISADGRWLVKTGHDETRIWDLAGENPSANSCVVYRFSVPALCAAVSADSRWLVAGGIGAAIHDLTDNNPSNAFARAFEGRATEFDVSAAISQDSHWAVTGSVDQTARIWDLTAPDPYAAPRILNVRDGPIVSVAVSPDNRWVVTAGLQARIWHLAGKNDPVNPRLFSGGDPGFVAISRDGRWLVTRSRDEFDRGLAQLWDLTAEDPVAAPHVLSGHRGWVNAEISSDSHWIVTAGLDDPAARVWDLTAEDPGTNPRVLNGHSAKISNVTISADSRWVVTRSNDNTARVWDLTAGDPGATHRVLNGNGTISSVTISADGRWIIMANQDGTARIFDLTAEDPNAGARALGENDRRTSVLAISPDSHWIVTGSTGNTAQVWDLTAADPGIGARVLSGHQDVITSAVVSSDSRWVVTRGMDNTARLWDLAAKDPGSAPRVVSGTREEIHNMQISPDCRSAVVFTGGNSIAHIWDLTAADPGASPRLLSGHQGPVMCVAISPDSRWVVTGSDDKTARIWDLTAENPSATACVLGGHQGPVFWVWFSADSRWIVTAIHDIRQKSDTNIRAWRWQWEDLVNLAAEVGRDFSREEWRQYFPNEPYRPTFAEPLLPAAPGTTTRTRPRARIIQDFHRREAAEAEAAGRWLAAAFHLRRLAELDRNDGALAQRAERALVNANDAAVLPGNLAYRAPDRVFPKASASHTPPRDRVERANDGIVNYRQSAFSGWTSWESPSPTDWLEIEFEKETEFSRVALAIYDEGGPRAGVQTPGSYDVEIWDGDMWQKIPDQHRTPEEPAGNRWNDVRFEKVKAKKVRVVFTHRGAARSGVTEIAVWP